MTQVLVFGHMENITPPPGRPDSSLSAIVLLRGFIFVIGLVLPNEFVVLNGAYSSEQAFPCN
jgi:hypothetical protein